MKSTMRSKDLQQLVARQELEIPTALVDRFAAELASDNMDLAVLGRVYERERARDRAGRRADGAYYTPDFLVDFIVERAIGSFLDDERGHQLPTVLDPACGGGVFLLAALSRLTAAGTAPSATVQRRYVAERCLAGVDCDSQAVAVCRLTIALAVGVELAMEEKLDLDRIREGDSLRERPIDSEQQPSRRFDAVVGNPPWGQKGFHFSSEDKAWLRQHYRTATGVLDPFKLFIERAYDLLVPGGRWGFVLPDTILLKNQQPVRDLILEQSCIHWIADAGRAFTDVNLDAVVIVASEGEPAADHELSIWKSIDATWRQTPPQEHFLHQRVFGELSGHRFNIHLNEGSLHLLRRLRRLPRFGDLFEVHEGVHSGNSRTKLFLAEPRNDASVPLVIGRGEIAPFSIAWAGAWLDTDPNALDRRAGDYANLGKPHWHLQKKIVVRRTGDHIIAAYDDVGRYCSNNLFLVLPRQPLSETTLRAYVALLNSSFMTWYFRTVQPRTGRLFAELKIEHLLDFPVPEAERWQGSSAGLGELARYLESCAQTGDLPAEVCRELDTIVQRLFDITEVEA